MKILEKLRAIWNAPKHLRIYQTALLQTQVRLAEVEKAVGIGQSVNIDIRPVTNKHLVVMVGKYKNADHVEMYEVESEYFTGLVEYLKGRHPHAALGRLDVPLGWGPGMKEAW